MTGLTAAGAEMTGEPTPTPTPIASCVAPPQGLVGWWPGDGSAVDYQGNHHGLERNGAGYGSGMVGPAFDFGGGVFDDVLVEHAPELIPAQLTLEAWVRPMATGFLQTLVTTEPDLFPAEAGYGFRQRTNNKFWFVVGRAGNSIYAESTTVLTPGNWYHLVGTYDGSQIRLYVNGVLEATTATTTVMDSTLPMRIGSFGVPQFGEYFDGLIDEVALYDRPLSAAEILVQYQAGSYGKCKPPIYIASIDPHYETAGSFYRVGTTVAISATNGGPAARATVKLFVTQPDGNMTAHQLRTDGDGLAAYSFYTAQTGTYRFEVRDVRAVGRVYDPSQNKETWDMIMVP